MPSIRTAIFAIVASLAGVSQADYQIDPTTVPLSTRQQWCTSEKTTCPIICEQTAPHSTLVNTCDAATLTYGCICGNGQQPNVTEYTLTLPYFVCTQWGTNCVAACGSDNACASSCREDHPCGALNPQRVNSTSSATMSATATQSSNVIYTGALGATGSSTPGKGAAAGLELGRLYGFVAVGVGIFAGFGLLL